VSADGLWAAWQSADIFAGENPNGQVQIFRGRTDGSLVEILTTDPLNRSSTPDISGNGQRIVYYSNADPLGTNPDNNWEIFLYDASRDTIQQLTVTAGANSYDPQISEDGTMVYFQSDAQFFGPEDGSLWRVPVSTGVIERAGGTATVSASGWSDTPRLDTDADGDRVVFVSALNATDNNADGNIEVWLADFSAVARITPSSSSPTSLVWDPDPRAVRYDVIRGDVAALQAAAGNTVDLGTVVCLENDSIDTNTLGFEDAGQPTSGQAFFFIHRYTQGVLDGPGSYGKGTGNAERVPATGDCPI
jgi:Tol biopolymer transport system component